MTVLLFKLAFAGIRSRLLASALAIAIASAAAATIVLALEVRSSGVDPWQRTFTAANGAHVLAFVPSQADARALAQLPGVTERGAPVPLVLAIVGPRGSTDRVELAGLGGNTAVNKPVLTAGSQLREEGIVLERSLANALGIDVGATLAVTACVPFPLCTSRRGSIDLGVLGTAVVPSQPRYPRRNPGLAWVTPATLARVAPDRTRWRWTEALRLANPSTAAAFTERAAAGFPAATNLYFETWQDQRENALGDAQGTQVIVTMFTILLLIVAFVVVGILVGARASDQHREIGLLKVAGFTPRQVGAVFAFESTALGLVAAGLGFALGTILAPRLAAPSAETLLGSPTIAANPWHILVASCVVLPVLLGGALTSTRRSTRFSALEAIRAGSSSPPTSRLARAVARSVLPLTIGLGLKDLLARRRRALLLTAAIALTDAVVVTALSLDATLDAQPAGKTSDFPEELLLLIYTLDTVLLLITATTLVAVALLSVRERIRDYGVLKAIGLTPTQITSTVVSAHTALAVAASLLAIPLGIGLYLALYRIAGDTTEDAVLAPWWSLAMIPIGTVLVVAAATILPALSATRIRTADALRYE
ncbi:MAG TPA: FtsX-like permease family protein [Gaiellaceae bacterium]|nr:FtsX-like permease family protein [Gaiellaceae bacterium]